MNEVEIIVKNTHLVKPKFYALFIQEKVRQKVVGFVILKFHKEFT